MMERHLRTEAHWEAWLALLERFPEEEQELDTRTAALVEELAAEAGEPDPVFRAIAAAAEVHGRLAAVEERAAEPSNVVPLRPPARRFVPFTGLALAAAALLAFAVGWWGGGTWGGPTGGTLGGAPGGGLVKVWGATDPIRLDPLEGVRPRITTRGEVAARWDGVDGTELYGWYVTDAGRRWVGGRGAETAPVAADVLRIAPDARGTLVLARIGPGVDPVAVADAIGRADHALDRPLGHVRVVAIDLEPVR